MRKSEPSWAPARAACCAREKDRSTTAAEPRVAVLLLAAGGSTRLGTPKQLVTFRGQSLLHRAAKAAAASGCAPVIVVLGAEAPRCRKELSGLAALVVVNESWQRGLASSIRAGLAALEQTRPAPAAAILMACDQPLVSGEVLTSLTEAYRESRAPVVAGAYAGTLGVPALFDRSLFAELRALEGDHGAKAVIERHKGRAVSVEFAGGAVDVDSAEDIAQLGER